MESTCCCNRQELDIIYFDRTNTGVNIFAKRLGESNGWSGLKVIGNIKQIT